MSKEYTAEALTGGDFTEEELAGLSEEERQAITSNDYQGDAGEADQDQGDDDDGEEAEDSLNGDGAVAAGNADKAESEELAGQDDAARTEEAEDFTATATTREVTLVRLPASVAEQFKARLDDLASKFYEGEIELGEMLDQRDAINREIYNAEVELTEQTKAANAWQTAQDAFFKANDVYMKDPKRYADLDTFVKTVAAQDGNTSFADVLAKAARMEAAYNGIELPAATGGDKQAGKKAGDTGKKPQSPRPAAPNLADIPAAAPNHTDGGEFAHIDSLTGMAYENAIARMSDEQRERYLKS